MIATVASHNEDDERQPNHNVDEEEGHDPTDDDDEEEEDVEVISTNPTSSSSSSTTTTIAWSVLSNLCFLSGSIGYVILAIQDWQDMSSYDNNDDDGYGWNLYTGVTLMGPLGYCFNALLDIGSDSMSHDGGDVEEDSIHPINEDEDNVEENPRMDDYSSWLQRQRQRRTTTTTRRKTWMIHGIFGLAALLDLVGTIIESVGFGKGILPSFMADDLICSTLAVHLYFLQAILAVGCGCHGHNNHRNPDEAQEDRYYYILESIGDWLFLMGSMVDVIISYMYLDDLEDRGHLRIVLASSLASSLLWLVDAILYLLVDVLEYYYYYGNVVDEHDNQVQVMRNEEAGYHLLGSGDDDDVDVGRTTVLIEEDDEP